MEAPQSNSLAAPATEVTQVWRDQLMTRSKCRRDVTDKLLIKTEQEAAASVEKILVREAGMEPAKDF